MRLALIDDAAQVEARPQGRAGRRVVLAQAGSLRAGAAQVEQVAHAGEQPRIVPGLGDVVGGARAHQLDRRLQVRPGGEQDDGQLRQAHADGAEKGHAFLAAGGLAVEVHVLDHQVHGVALQSTQALSPGCGR